jgi:NAD-specific glutamate dehydrogenase
MLTKTIKDDILDQQRTLTLNIINSYPKIDFKDKINHWCNLNKAKISIYNKFIDSVKSMEDIDSAKLVVSIKQGEALIK